MKCRPGVVADEVAALLQGDAGVAGPGLLLASLVLAPAAEELLFRGFMLPCLAARMSLPGAVRPAHPPQAPCLRMSCRTV